jgi:hypothetical protein
MARQEYASWHGDYQEYYAGDAVTIARLSNARREFGPDDSYDPQSHDYDPSIVSTIDFAASQMPGNTEADWGIRVTDHSFRFRNEYVRPNSAAHSRFSVGGFLSTAKLNGCIALAAAYRDEQDGIRTFLGHYDAEYARQTDGNGKLRLFNMFRDFAGPNAVRAALAYAAVQETQPGRPYEPEDYPIDALARDFRELPSGSKTLLVPYQTGFETMGNRLYVGGSNIRFGWNGHAIEVGEREAPSARRLARMRTSFAPTAAVLDAPDDIDEFMG